MNDLLQILSQPELWPWKWWVVFMIFSEGLLRFGEATGWQRKRRGIFWGGSAAIGWVILAGICIWWL